MLAIGIAEDWTRDIEVASSGTCMNQLQHGDPAAGYEICPHLDADRCPLRVIEVGRGLPGTFGREPPSSALTVRLSMGGAVLDAGAGRSGRVRLLSRGRARWPPCPPLASTGGAGGRSRPACQRWSGIPAQAVVLARWLSDGVSPVGGVAAIRKLR